MLNINIITLALGLRLRLATKGEWVEKMFWDSSTLPQVWENESQHSQVVFSLWKLKSFEVPNVQNISANRKWCKIGSNVSLERS